MALRHNHFVNIDAVDKSNMTPLHLASVRRADRKIVVELLTHNEKRWVPSEEE